MIYLLTGDDYDVQIRIKEISEGTNLISFDLSSVEPNDILSEINNTSLFEEKKTFKVTGIKKSGNAEWILGLIEGYDSPNSLIVAENLPRNSKIFKLISKNGRVESFETRDIHGWMAQHCSEMGLNLDRELINRIVDKAGENKMILSTEVDKLKAFDKVDKELVDKVISASSKSDVFELLDAMNKKDKDGALRIYDRLLKQKISIHEIIGIINWQVGVLVGLKAVESGEKTLKDLKISPYVARKSERLASSLNKKEIEELVQQLFKLDVKTKSSPGGELLLRSFIVSLSS